MTTPSWNDIFGSVPGPLQKIAATLRDTIRHTHSDVVETARPGWGAVQYGFGPQNKEIHSYLMPQKDRINLGFYFGTLLPDPDRLLEGTGTALRHVKVTHLKQAASQPIASLIDAAVAERKSALGVT